MAGVVAVVLFPRHATGCSQVVHRLFTGLISRREPPAGQVVKWCRASASRLPSSWMPTVLRAVTFTLVTATKPQVSTMKVLKVPAAGRDRHEEEQDQIFGFNLDKNKLLCRHFMVNLFWMLRQGRNPAFRARGKEIYHRRSQRRVLTGCGKPFVQNGLHQTILLRASNTKLTLSDIATDAHR